MRNGTGVVGAAALGMMLASLAGCAGGSGSGSAQGAPCDEATLTGSLGAALSESMMTVDSLGGIECADGWAVVEATVSGEEGPSIEEQYVFVSRDGIWILKSPEGTCGTVVEDGIRPDDASLPSSLWELACADL